MKVNEALLEIIYFVPLREMFEEYLNQSIKSIYKPSQQKEAVLGFDQAWITEEMTEEEFEAYLTGSGRESSFYAYLLQFKIVTKQKISSNAKFTIHNSMRDPYCRSLLSTTRSNSGSNRDFSQHEFLYQWKHNHNNMEVYYACPMVFDTARLFSPNLNEYLLNNLVLADLSSSPNPESESWHLHKKHHLMWNDNLLEETSVEEIYWCSDPMKGKFLSVKKFVEQVCLRKLDSTQLKSILKEFKEYQEKNNIHDDISITILEI